MPAKGAELILVKLIYIGNAVAVTVPAAMRRALGWKRGDHMAVQLVRDEDGHKTAIRIWSIENGIHYPEWKENQTTLRKIRS